MYTPGSKEEAMAYAQDHKTGYGMESRAIQYFLKREVENLHLREALLELLRDVTPECEYRWSVKNARKVLDGGVTFIAYRPPHAEPCSCAEGSSHSHGWYSDCGHIAFLNSPVNCQKCAGKV